MDEPVLSLQKLRKSFGALVVTDDVTFDLISVHYHSLKAGHDYGQYVRDAENAGLDDISQFFRQVMKEDSERAARCHELLRQVSGTDQAGPATR